MKLSLSITGLDDLVIQKVGEELEGVLAKTTKHLEMRIGNVTKDEAIAYLGASIYLRAGERDKRLTPLLVSGSIGKLYNFEELKQFNRWILKNVKSGSLPDYYLTNISANRNSKNSTNNEKELHDDHPNPGRPENLRRNGRDVPRPAAERP